MIVFIDSFQNRNQAYFIILGSIVVVKVGPYRHCVVVVYLLSENFYLWKNRLYFGVEYGELEIEIKEA